MKVLWLTLSARFAAFSPRERALIAAAVLAGVVALSWLTLLAPELRTGELAQRGLVEQRERLRSLQAQIAELQAPAHDPDVAARAQLAALQKSLAELNAHFAALEGSLVPPQRMSGLLEDLIGRNSGVRLLSLRTLPVTAVAPVPASAGAKAAAPGRDAVAAAGDPVSAGLFRHGVEIRLEGSYQDLATYLERIEKAQLKLLWSDLSLSTEQQPKLVLTLTVYTLSMDRTWLIV